MYPKLSFSVTKPNRSVHLNKNLNDTSTPQPPSLPFSPLLFFQQHNNAPRSPSLLSTSLIPRAPVVHFFVCDYGNAKVKTLTDDFIQILINNGIKVYTETYQTHQPGYQVRAVSLNTQADFFFQIHSKTAGPGHVRLYESGQPKRMTMEEAVAVVWSTWKSRCGALSHEEVDLLSKEKLVYLLKEYANIEPQNLDISSLQIQCREMIEHGTCIRPLTEKMREFEVMLRDSRSRLSSSRIMSYEWTKEPGAVLSRMPPATTIARGLSQPLRDVLIAIVDQTFKKVRAIIDVLERQYVSTPPLSSLSSQQIQQQQLQQMQMQQNNIFNGGMMNNLDNGGMQLHNSDLQTTPGDGSSWNNFIESVDDDRVGSINIASYGDESQHVDNTISTPVLIIDEY